MQDELTPKQAKEQERLIDARISLLQLAKELGNIHKACKAAGIARSSFYDMKRAYEQLGCMGLVKPERGSKNERASQIQTSRHPVPLQEMASMSWMMMCPGFKISGLSHHQRTNTLASQGAAASIRRSSATTGIRSHAMGKAAAPGRLACKIQRPRGISCENSKSRAQNQFNH